MQGVLGLAVIMALAWLLGERRRVNFRRIAVGLGLSSGWSFSSCACRGCPASSCGSIR
ncbi:MAG: hypothetical protein V8Q84_06480 [Bilophila sp.]